MFRLSGKKLLLYSTLLGSGLLLVLCFQNKFQVSPPHSSSIRSSSSGQHHSSHNNAKTKSRRLAEQDFSSRTINSVFNNSSHETTVTSTTLTTTTTLRSSSSHRNVIVRNTTESVLHADRPWYMVGGNQRPSFSNDQLPIFPEDQPFSDRIPGSSNIDTSFQIEFVAMSKQYWEV